jgi:drug/metabolite transporter (DMT)-like permease
LSEIKKNLKEYYISIVFITLCVIFWGYSFISTKIVLKELGPISIAFFRQIIASAILIPWLIYSKSYSKISIKCFFLIATSGFFGIVLYFLFENTGLQYTEASNASIIVAAVPIFTLISEVAFYKLKASINMFICIVASILGVYLVISVNGTLDFSSKRLLGNLLMIGAMAAWVVYTIINKSLVNSHSSIFVTTLQSVCSIFLFIPFTIHEVSRWNRLTLVPLLNLIYLGIFCSAFSYFFYIYASKRLGATVSSSFLNLIPVVSVIFGYMLLDEKLTLIQIAGMGLIILCLFILSRKEHAIN